MRVNRRATVAVAVVVALAGCLHGGKQDPTTTPSSLDWRGPFSYGLGNVVATGGAPRFPESPEALERLDAFMAAFQERRMKECNAEAPLNGGYVPGIDRGDGIVRALGTCIREKWATFDDRSTNQSYIQATYDRLLRQAYDSYARAMRALIGLNNSAEPIEAEVQAILQFKTIQYLPGIKRLEERAKNIRPAVTLQSLVLHEVLLDAVADFVEQYPWRGTSCVLPEGLAQRVGNDVAVAIREARRLGNMTNLGDYGRDSEVIGPLSLLYNASVANGWVGGLRLVESGVSLNLAYWRSFPNATLPTVAEAKILYENRLAQRWSLTDSAFLKTEVADLRAVFSDRILAERWGLAESPPETARTVMVWDQMVWHFDEPCRAG